MPSMFTKNSFDTIRLNLRPFTQADVNSFLELVEDSEVAKYFGNLSSMADAYEFFESILHQDPNYDRCFAVSIKSTNQIIGYINFYSYPPNSVLIEYITKKEFRDRGYAKETLSGLLSYLKIYMPHISTAIFQVNKENVASQKILTGFGAAKRDFDKNNFEFSIVL